MGCTIRLESGGSDSYRVNFDRCTPKFENRTEGKGGDRRRKEKMVGVLQSVTMVTSTSGSNLGNPDDFIPRKNQNQSNRLSLSTPTFIIRTESNVRKMRRRKPEPFCAVCEGSGRVDCHYCHGKGRTNSSELMMLPKGEWPKWCKTCGGSGLAYCNRCLGTGEDRDIMGFHFMKRDSGLSSTNPVKCQTDDKLEHLTAADLLLSET